MIPWKRYCRNLWYQQLWSKEYAVKHYCPAEMQPQTFEKLSRRIKAESTDNFGNF